MAPSSGHRWVGFSWAAFLTELSPSRLGDGEGLTFGVIVGWDTGVMTSLSHSELASVGGYFWPWKPSSQGRVPGPSVALAAVPASAAQI